MKLCVIGTGYVGLVSGACLADVGNTVSCVDKNAEKIAALTRGEMPIYEPGLREIIRRCESEGRLFFTTSLAEGLADADACFITVDTPPDLDGRPDLANVFAVARQIGETLNRPLIVATKSTVPVGATLKVKDVIAEALKTRGLDPQKLLAIASNPEFLKEGSAVADFMKPNRVIVGSEDDETAEKLRALYSPFMRRRDRFIKMGIASAELTKYAANAMLATRISFMNEMARLCEKTGADINDVRLGLSTDPRIGPDFLYPGPGYGGSCLPKDTKAIINMGKDMGSELSVIESASRANDLQREWFWNKIAAHFSAGGSSSGLKNKTVAIWGAAFKAETDDVRFSPALYFIEKMLDAGAAVTVFDPAAAETCKTALGGGRAAEVRFTQRAQDAVEGADALVVCTEWREFRSPDFARIKSLMRAPVIFDCRNLYEPKTLTQMGFTYHGIGRGVHHD